jgi:RIO-like serine/threonine protein kinase
MPISADILSPTVMENVVDAFHSIHELGVLHADVRKENILIREDKSVVIIDFDRSAFIDVSVDEIIAENEAVQALLTELQEDGCRCVDKS